MSAKGYIQVRAYTSYAQIPLQDVSITITDTDGNALGYRLTNRSGRFDDPFELTVPDTSAGLSSDTGIIPFSVVNLYAKLDNYEEIEIKNLQVFPNTVTIQNLEMIPLPELPDNWVKAEIFTTPPQNL